MIHFGEYWTWRKQKIKKSKIKYTITMCGFLKQSRKSSFYEAWGLVLWNSCSGPIHEETKRRTLLNLQSKWEICCHWLGRKWGGEGRGDTYTLLKGTHINQTIQNMHTFFSLKNAFFWARKRQTVHQQTIAMKSGLHTSLQRRWWRRLWW